MKKLLALIVMILLVTGCSTLSRKNEYVLDNANIHFSLPKIWEVVEEEDSVLALTQPDADMTVIVYKKSNTELVSADDLLNEKILAELQEADDYSLVKNYGQNIVIDRIIYSQLYSVERDGIQTQYYFNVMEFIGSETYVYVLYETKEPYMKYHLSDINRILVRMKWNGEGIDIAMN